MMEYTKMKLNTHLHFDIMRRLTNSVATYPVLFQKTYEFSKLAGVQTVREMIFTERELPHTVYMLMITADRRLGDYTLK